MAPKRDVIFFMAPDLLSVGWKILGMEAGIIGEKGKGGKGEKGKRGFGMRFRILPAADLRR